MEHISEDLHHHTWSCGCKTWYSADAFEIIPCSDDCGILKAVKMPYVDSDGTLVLSVVGGKP